MSNSNRNPASRQGNYDFDRGKQDAERQKSEKIENKIKEQEKTELPNPQ